MDASSRETATVALWAVNMAKPLRNLDEWLSGVEAKLAEAAAGGADILVIPEYVSEQWLQYAPADLPTDQEIDFMATEGEKALPALSGLAVKHGVALLAGSFPIAAPGRDPDGAPHVNRAHLFLPDGRRIVHDKLSLTPSEMDPAGWNLNTGSRITLVEWNGLRLAMLICLDIEMPALSVALAQHAAKARAVELQTAVCVVGCIGSIPSDTRPNYSGAAVYLPCEEAFGYDGRFAEIAGAAATEADGPLLIARDIPVADLRRMRQGGAEVWPGAWSAAHVSF
ncbi:MAG: nitrilase-related carbon-nitrogen hydrolase [Acidihalobacter sp.]